MAKLPAHMRAWELTGAGIDALRLAERPVPEPAPGEVLVRVRASSLNYRDLSTVRDPHARGLQLPLVPNSDCAGEVVAVGAGTESPAPGTRVAGCFFQRWADGRIDAGVMESALGGAIEGVLSESALLRADGVVEIPEHLSFAQAATLPCAGVTAWHCLVGVGAVGPGETVLLLGTGGVSVMALQLAGLLGARAIVTSSDDRKLERARALGAWQTVNYRNEREWDTRVLELTAGQGVDFVLEVGGAGTLARSLNAVRTGGRIALIGVLTRGQLDPTAIMRKSVGVQGVYVGSRRMFLDLNRALAAHSVEPVIEASFAFEQAPEAFQALADARHFGKLVIEL